MTIPYNFMPVPRYLYDNGYFSDPKTAELILFLLRRTKTIPREVTLKNKKFLLQPFEFSCSREKIADQTSLTEDEVRTRLKHMVQDKILKNSPNSIPNYLTFYIWETDTFCENNPQLNPQLIPNRSPTDPQDIEYKNIRKIIDIDLIDDAGEEKMKNLKGEEIPIRESEIYAAMLPFNFPTEVVKEAIEKARKKEGPIHCIKSYIQSICENDMRKRLEPKQKTEVPRKQDSAPPRCTAKGITWEECQKKMEKIQ